MMYISEHPFNEEDFIQTSTGTIVSRSAMLQKPESVEIPGGRCIIEKEVNIRGDLAPVKINRYSIVSERTILKPPSITDSNGAVRSIPMSIGKYVFIGSDCVIESAVIGMGVYIGDNCRLSPRCILKDFVTVEDGTVVPPDMVNTFLA